MGKRTDTRRMPGDKARLGGLPCRTARTVSAPAGGRESRHAGRHGERRGASFRNGGEDKPRHRRDAGRKNLQVRLRLRVGDAGDEPDGGHAAFRVHFLVSYFPCPHWRGESAQPVERGEESRHGVPPAPHMDIHRHRRRQRDAPPQQRGEPLPEPRAESCVIM